MNRFLFILLLLKTIYAEDVCLNRDFDSYNPMLAEIDSEFELWAKAQMTTFAKEFGVGFCLKHHKTSLEIIEIKMFDTIFRQIDSVGNAIYPRCYTSNNAKKLKEDIKNYVISQKRLNTMSSCIAMYDTPQYQAKIEKIVKKYCKDCK